MLERSERKENSEDYRKTYVSSIHACMHTTLKVTFYGLSVTEPRPRRAMFEQLIHLQDCPDLMHPQTVLWWPQLVCPYFVIHL